jgi:hypothetical protein
MAENVENLTLEDLRRLDGKFDVMAADIREIKTTIAGMMQVLASHDHHMLRLEIRLEKIEKRSIWPIRPSQARRALAPSSRMWWRAVRSVDAARPSGEPH